MKAAFTSMRRGGLEHEHRAAPTLGIGAGRSTVMLHQTEDGRAASAALASRVWRAVPALAVAILASPTVPTEVAAEARQPADLAELVDGDARAPGGWIDYCVASPTGGCFRMGQPVAVEADSDVLALLSAVQASVDAAIEPRVEAPGIDNWEEGPSFGDCEDYALTKRRALLVAGLPAGALRLATAYTEHGEYHAVLTVATTDGTLVLDNRFPTVRDWRSMPYRWVTLQRPDWPFRWLRLADEITAAGS